MRGDGELENSCSIFDVFLFTTPFAPTALSFAVRWWSIAMLLCFVFSPTGYNFLDFSAPFLTLFRSQLTYNRSGKYYCGDILVNSVTRLI